jgi:hypothetical protein
MKIIFLDIDGVLNTNQTLADQGRQDAICPIKMALFANVIKKTGANIVISSTWRKHQFAMNTIQMNFVGHGIINNYLGKTKCLNRSRYHEIQDYLDTHPKVHNFAVLDDNLTAWYENNHFFRTSGFIGLTKGICDDLIRFLNDD